VFHLAAFASVPRSIAEPERCMDVNVTGTVRVLEEARRTNVRRVVFAGSSSAYGEGGSEPRQESMTPSPVSPYAASKLAGEYALRAWSKSYALDAVTLRYFNIFGPRQSAESAYAAVIAAFIRRYSENQPPVIHGDGSQSRDFTYIDNAVLANILAATSERPFEGQAINVGAGRSTTVLELAEEIGRMMGATHLAPVFEPARPGDVRFSLASLERARSLLGYEPVCPLTEGLRRTIEATVGTNPRAQARELKA